MYAHGLYNRYCVWTGWFCHILLVTIELVHLGYFALDLAGRLHHVPAGYGVGCALAFLFYCTEPMEVVLWSYHLLEPWVYLSLQTCKAALWSALSGVAIWVTIWSAVQPSWMRGPMHAAHVLTVLSYWTTFIYATMVFHQHRKSKGYQEELGGIEEAGERADIRLAGHRQPSGVYRPASSIYEPY
ncbi:Hypothetical predicted protein [Lecanosticta acicola]|uniref:Uncharacterized protein n=1 Tax=Lecanosticta acicola TaxID=111012 RepID=A0AAI8W1K6_9PEZI|nr:Hypothetical predicted protein [Lecanosticta acicola]